MMKTKDLAFPQILWLAMWPLIFKGLAFPPTKSVSIRNNKPSPTWELGPKSQKPFGVIFMIMQDSVIQLSTLDLAFLVPVNNERRSQSSAGSNRTGIATHSGIRQKHSLRT